MKTFLTALLLSLLAFAAFTAFAQEQEEDTNLLITYLDVNCYKDVTPLLESLTTKFGETPLLAGKSILPIANFLKGEPDLLDGVTMMYVNQETGTFTNVMILPDGSGCQVLFGENFTPISN